MNLINILKPYADILLQDTCDVSISFLINPATQRALTFVVGGDAYSGRWTGTGPIDRQNAEGVGGGGLEALNVRL